VSHGENALFSKEREYLGTWSPTLYVEKIGLVHMNSIYLFPMTSDSS